jgi:hypothetical protein
MGKRVAWFVTALLWAATVYCWILPWFWPRGVYGWGHYRLVDIIVGFPLAVAAMEATFLLSCPVAVRRPLAFRLIPATFLLLFVAAAADAGYTIIFRETYLQRHTDFWFDGISRRDNLPDDELGFVRKSGLSWEGPPTLGALPVHYQTDENGFRNPPGQTHADVVFIGDSFTEGTSVPEAETLARQVERETGLSVVNLGRGLYGPQQEWIVLNRFGFSYKPRAVIWQVFEGNDLSDARRFAKWTADPQSGEPFALRYSKRSPLVRLLGMTLPSEFRSQPLSLPDGSVGEVALDYRYAPHIPESEAAAFQEVCRTIWAGHTECKEKGIALLVVFVPIKVRVLAPFIHFESEAARDRYLPGGAAQSSADFGASLGDYCRSIGCPYLDTFAALRASAEKDCRPVYQLGHDTHFGIAGNQVVSEQVVDWLVSRGLATRDRAKSMGGEAPR